MLPWHIPIITENTVLKMSGKRYCTGNMWQSVYNIIHLK